MVGLGSGEKIAARLDYGPSRRKRFYFCGPLPLPAAATAVRRSSIFQRVADRRPHPLSSIE
jgi:hypothetical protein